MGTSDYNFSHRIEKLSFGDDHAGIYFKYDLSALKVEVTQDRPGFIQFLVRLCAGVGGLVATSTIVSNLIKNMVDFYCCKRGGGDKMTPLHQQQWPIQGSSPSLWDDQLTKGVQLS